MTIPTDENELTISAMLPSLNSDEKPRLVLGRGGFTLTLDSTDMARLDTALSGLFEQLASQSEPEPPMVDGISTKPLDEPSADLEESMRRIHQAELYKDENDEEAGDAF